MDQNEIDHFGRMAAQPEAQPARTRGHLGSTVDGGIDDHDEAPPAVAAVHTDPLYDDAYLRGVALGFPQGDSRRWNLCRIADRIEAAQPWQEPVAWMIECGNGFTGWWTGAGKLDCRFFDKDPNKGKRFASKAEAEEAIAKLGHSCQIATSHAWIAAPVPALGIGADRSAKP